MSEPAGVRAMLEADRASTVQRIVGLHHDRASILDSSESSSTDDEHDPEGATLAFEREQVTALLKQAAAHLAELDGAFGRLEVGSYGQCVVCGQPIPPERLAARPASGRCVRCVGT